MISICIIVKNESKNLSTCLEKLSHTSYEIVVVDTGSIDDSKDIAYKYTDKVYDFVWVNDFSAARNFAISKATKEYIVMIDSDEFLTYINKVKLEELLKTNEKSVGRLHRNNLFTRDGIGFNGKELVNRIFPKKYFKYSGKIHEQVLALDGKDYMTYAAPVFVDHIGYDGSIEDIKEKANRNIKMLLEVLEEDGDDPYILYQLGKGYYLDKEYEKAAEYFRRALTFDLNIELEYVIDMIEIYGYSLINSEQYEEALLLENIYNEFSGSADFVFLMGLIYMQNILFEKAEKEFLKAATYPDCKVEGVNSYLAYYNVGVIAECLEDKERAKYYFEKCGDYEPALQGVLRCK